ncbi:acyltransferase domain-containing protein [Paenibacillus chibensis]|uniref:acyltransferase domain-containing protein n=1 Tax=Paenibacillus chibensis TaxID=59846 RepID=UPI000FD710A6|nr:acyltransferase domain-containing protein [Paenibacillus chibensis]MEC0373154.1 acyltransferase domain-containing protein [Paenibacillus chibensis]
MDRRLNYDECTAFCDFDYLPEGLEAKYNRYHGNDAPHIIPRDFLSDIFDQYNLPEHTRQRLIRGIENVESNAVLFHFTKFLVGELILARQRCDEAHYTNMTPGCMNEDGELYSFLLLLACVIPSMEMLKKRSIPQAYYEQIPHQPLKLQLDKLVLHGDAKVQDFPWVMNFYTCSIFLLDRFYFIPYRFGDPFTMFRHVNTKQVVALRHAGEEFRSDGQRNGTNDVYDPPGCFVSEWIEDEDGIVANRINPMGFVERNMTPMLKKEWKAALREGDLLLALHIPSGPGYTPERLKNSMSLAIEFYGTYFPEMPVKGFWSASWLYDTRLSLILDNERSNIVHVQRQFYNYPTLDGDGMLRHEVFGDRHADPAADSGQFTTSLQKAAAAYMQTGARFNTLSMIVLKEEIERIGSMPYITDADIGQFRRIVDSHLREVYG